jgi:hypothetical protein
LKIPQNKDHRTDLETAENTLTMLADVIVKLIDMTEVKLLALKMWEEGFQKAVSPDAIKVQIAMQIRINFENRLIEVHHAQLSATTKLDLGPSLAVQRTNLSRSSDINEQLKAVPGLVGGRRRRE